MALIPGWMPPSRENWQMLSLAWQCFPLFTTAQWFINWYPQGKTSVESRFNLPGKIGWAAMETPGFVTVLYIMMTLPAENGVKGAMPWQNWAMAGMFTIHYIYRALLAPLLLNPSMSPIHIVVAFFALCFQIVNGTVIGGWLASYGPRTEADWSSRSTLALGLGAAVWLAGFAGNIYHDDVLRQLRRPTPPTNKSSAKGKQVASRDASGQAKKYVMPTRGLFKYILYPHFVCEWVEWAGFWIFGGLACAPAMAFLVNEVSTMWPRARQGWRWYVDRFGREEVGKRGAIWPSF